MKKLLLPLLALAALALPARAGNWRLVADSNQNLANNGAKATIKDADMTKNDLRVTVENAADHTLMLGRHTTDYAKANATARADRNGAYSGVVDLTKPIYADGDDTPWTIVSVANMAFYNNKALLTAPDGILDLTTVTNIGIGAFGNITGMPGFRLSSRLERIGASAFMSTFATVSYAPQLPASLKVVETGAFCHNDQYDGNIAMNLTGEIELRGVEVIQSGAFSSNHCVTAITIGPKLVEFGKQGINVRQKSVAHGVFETCNALKSITWLGPAPTNTIPKNTFYNITPGSCVTNYVYVDYLDGWTNNINASGMTVGAKVADVDVWPIAPNDNKHKGTIWLSLLPGHPPVEGAAIFNDAPTLSQSGNVFTFRANMSEGEDCNLFAIFTATDGTAVTNTLATSVDGDPDEFYTLTPTGLTVNRTYSFGVLGIKGTEATYRAGVGTFFNGEVSVAAPAAFSEAGGTGSFVFSRTGTDGDVVIPFAVSGTASEFDNFLEIPRTVTIPNGSASAMVPVTGVVDLANDLDTTLTLATDTTSLFLVASGATSATTTIENWSSPTVAGFSRTMSFMVEGYDGARGDLANFPVLVRIPAGKVSNPDQMAFFDENGDPLHFEVDTWNASGESLVWVGLPTLAHGTKVTLASGRSGYTSPNLAYGLWRKAGYVLVLHCGDEGPALTCSTVQRIGGTARSTSNGSAGSEGLVATGAAGAARTISNGAKNATDWGAIRVENFERYMADTTRFTVSLWLNHRSNQVVGKELLFGNKIAYVKEAAGFTALIDPSRATNSPAFFVAGASTFGGSGFATHLSVVSNTDGAEVPFSGVWTHASFSFQPSPSDTFFHVAGSRAYCDYSVKDSSEFSGTYATSTTKMMAIPSLGSDVPVFFGHGSATETANSFKGAMDEIRVRNGVSSDDWAFAEYETIHNSGFLQAAASTDVLLLLW